MLNPAAAVVGFAFGHPDEQRKKEKTVKKNNLNPPIQSHVQFLLVFGV